MARLFSLISFMCVLQACGQQTSEVDLKLNGSTYHIPKAQLDALVRDQGQILVRINSPDREFKLAHNSRTDREQRETGKLTISGVNDQFGPYETLSSTVGAVICIDGVDWNCGFELDDGGVRWSVVFARSRLPQVDSLKQRAAHELEAYRRLANVKV